MKDFNYGTVSYRYRSSIKGSLDDCQETTLNKCILIGLELKNKTMGCDYLIPELQIVYRDYDDKSQCLCLDLNDYIVTIKLIGDMQFDIRGLQK